MLHSTTAVQAADDDMHSACMAVADHIACAHAAPVIAMPMVTLHWHHTGWFEIHHGALRKLLPLVCQHNGRSMQGYAARLSGAQALIQARAANPGVDVRLIETVLLSNEYTLFDRRAA